MLKSQQVYTPTSIKLGTRVGVRTLGAVIRRHRTPFGTIAKSTRLSPSTISNLANGITVSPHATTVAQVARYYGIEVYL
jgi:transcriptional regulator with XRE-family HTH domain